jgi:hypothetical protein
MGALEAGDADVRFAAFQAIRSNGDAPRNRTSRCQPTWPFSSFTKCVTLGMYPIDWAIEEAELADAGGRL